MNETIRISRESEDGLRIQTWTFDARFVVTGGPEVPRSIRVKLTLAKYQDAIRPSKRHRNLKPLFRAAYGRSYSWGDKSGAPTWLNATAAHGFDHGDFRGCRPLAAPPEIPADVMAEALASVPVVVVVPPVAESVA